MKAIGLLSTTIGAVIALGSFAMETSVAYVVNIGLLQQQELVFLTGATLFLAGIVLFSAGAIVDQRHLVAIDRGGRSIGSGGVVDAPGVIQSAAAADRPPVFDHVAPPRDTPESKWAFTAGLVVMAAAVLGIIIMALTNTPGGAQ